MLLSYSTYLCGVKSIGGVDFDEWKDFEVVAQINYDTLNHEIVL